jgi:hypothetical protein
MKAVVTPKTYFRTLTLLTSAQAFTLFIFSIIILFLYANDQLTGDKNQVDLFITLVPIIIVISLTTGYFIFKKLTESISDSVPLKVKLIKYQQAVIVRCAFMELTGLSGAVAALITGELYFLMAPLFAILLFYFTRPSTYTITADLKLSSPEKSLLENPESNLDKVD